MRLLLFSSLLVASQAACIPNTTTPDDDCCTTALFGATAFSIIYGLPLAGFSKFASPLLDEVGSNVLNHERELITPDFGDVVSPNEDTLYSSAALDLSSKDLVLSVSDIDDGRFWVFPFYDPYGNNFANIGSVNGDGPGRYLLRYAPSGGKQGSTDTECDEYQGIIHAPTAYVSLVARIYVRENTTADIEKIAAWQDAMWIEQIEKPEEEQSWHRHHHRNGSYNIPALSVDLLNTTTAFNNSIAQELELLARLSPGNPPIIANDSQHVSSCLRTAGIHDGHYHSQTGVNLTEAAAIANSTIQSSVPDNIVHVGNKWYIDCPTVQADFGTSYAYRAYMSIEYYLGLQPSQALYPRNEDFSGGPFSDIPPVSTGDGFWSLTLYSEDFELIPNAIGRYSIGTRNSLTFDDESSGFPAVASNSSGVGAKPFQILIQAADEAPPGNWTSNWLPGPTGGGIVNFNLRWYAPSSELSDGTYIYPVVEQADAK